MSTTQSVYSGTIHTIRMCEIVYGTCRNTQYMQESRVAIRVDHITRMGMRRATCYSLPPIPTILTNDRPSYEIEPKRVPAATITHHHPPSPTIPCHLPLFVTITTHLCTPPMLAETCSLDAVWRRSHSHSTRPPPPSTLSIALGWGCAITSARLLPIMCANP